MKRLTILTVLALLAIVLVWRVQAADKVLTIKEIMSKLNKPGGLRPNLGQDLMDADPDWEEIQKQTKEFSALAAQLGKNTPTVGEKASWDKLCASYAADAAALDAAAQKKDKLAAKAAHAKLSADTMCKACHSVHQKK
jgi:cytochrome c553